jgi:hypothetical protein
MNWVIAFLARTSSGTYKEVAKFFMLPHINTVYQKTAEIITTKNDKAYCLHMNTIQSISDRAHRENWTSHQRIGAIAQDSANINSGIEHDYVSNTLKGGDESHCIATLSRMFNAMAQKVKDAQSSDDDERENSPTLAVQQNSILDNHLLAKEHLVFKFSRLDQTKLPLISPSGPLKNSAPLGSALFRGQFTPSKYARRDDFAAFEMTDMTATCTDMFPAPPSSASLSRAAGEGPPSRLTAGS